MKHTILLLLALARVSQAGITTAGGVLISTPINGLDGSAITNVTAYGGTNGVYGGVGLTNGVLAGNGSGLTNVVSAYNGKDVWTNQLADQSMTGTNLTASTNLSITLFGAGVWDVTCYATLDGGATGGSACSLTFNIPALVTGTCLSGYDIGSGFRQPGIQMVGWPAYQLQAQGNPPSYTQQYADYWWRYEIKTTNTTIVTLKFSEKTSSTSAILKANSSLSAKFIR